MITKLGQVCDNSLVNGLSQVQHLVAVSNELLNEWSSASNLNTVGSLQDSSESNI
jgi:hypothetical protein